MSFPLPLSLTVFVLSFFVYCKSEQRNKAMSIAVFPRSSFITSPQKSAFNLIRSMLINDFQAQLWDSINTEMREELFILINDEEAKTFFF
jgi:hypothetical protein